MSAWGTSFGASWGASWGAITLPSVFLNAGGGAPGVRAERKRWDIAADLRATMAALDYATEKAQAITAKAAQPAAVDAVQARLADSLGEAHALLQDAKGVLERTQLQLAIARADHERARLRAEQEAAAAIAKARRRHVAALVAVLNGEDE